MSSIREEIVKQSKDMGNFRCNSCKYYRGSLICDNNVFIAFTGANMNSCMWYRARVVCIHCGRVT